MPNEDCGLAVTSSKLEANTEHAMDAVEQERAINHIAPLETNTEACTATKLPICVSWSFSHVFHAVDASPG